MYITQELLFRGLYALYSQLNQCQVQIQFSRSVMSKSAIPWPAARQASLFTTISLNLLKLMSIESVMPSNHLILCRHFLLPPAIFPSIRVFSSESALRIRWPKYWSFSFSISPSSEYSGLIYLLASAQPATIQRLQDKVHTFRQ